MPALFSFNRFTILALLIIAASLSMATYSVVGNGGAISWDAFGYYYYLKLFFIDNSLVLENLNSVNQVFEKYNPSSTVYQFTNLPNGRIIVRYPVGQALLYLPFFIIAHITALFSDFPADGFSKPYDIFVRIGGLVYHFLGFYFVARILRLHFSDKVVGITLVILLFGTNAYSLMAGSALSAQGSLFFLIALFIWLVDRYYKEKTNGLILAVAAVFGLICLNRPTDFVTIVPAILWPLTITGLSVKEEIKSFFGRRGHVIRFAVVIILFAFIQFGYWKYAGGSCFINSYGNPAEGLDFLSPHTFPFLLSFKSGWFIYTPLMLFVIIYLIVRAFKKDGSMIVVLAYTVLFVYLASSWTNWWYGGGFSQRAMGQAYALLSLPLAGLLDYIFFRKKLRTPLAILIMGFTALSIWQTKQYKNGVLTSETVTARYYFASFFDLYQNPDNEKFLAFSHYDIYIQPNYELPENYTFAKTYVFNLKDDEGSIDGKEFLNGFKFRYKDLTEKDHCFILFSAVFEDSPPAATGLVTTFDHNGSYGYQFRSALDNLINEDEVANEYTTTSVYLTPILRTTEDYISAYIWNREKMPGRVKSMKFEVFEKPEASDLKK